MRHIQAKDLMYLAPIVIYIALNFFIAGGKTGVIEDKGGTYYLRHFEYNEYVVENISKDEFDERQLYSKRIFTGHPLAFAYISCYIYFLTLQIGRRRSDPSNK